MGCNGLARITPKAVRELGDLEVYLAWPGSSRAPPHPRPTTSRCSAEPGLAVQAGRAKLLGEPGGVQPKMRSEVAVLCPPLPLAVPWLVWPRALLTSIRGRSATIVLASAGGGGQRLPHAWAGRPDAAACIWEVFGEKALRHCARLPRLASSNPRVGAARRGGGVCAAPQRHLLARRGHQRGPGHV